MKCVPSVQLTCLRPGHAAVLKKVSTAYGRAAALAPASMPPDLPLGWGRGVSLPVPLGDSRETISHVGGGASI